MTRHEQYREDLLAEATALVERAEFRIAGEPEPVIVGFRRNGAASVYFGQDVAYHFNTGNQLRRAFIDGRLIKADAGRLASLARMRTSDETQLVRHDLDQAESTALLAEMSKRMAQLHDHLVSGQAALLREVSEIGGVTGRIVNWLRHLPNPIEVAHSPRAI